MMFNRTLYLTFFESILKLEYAVMSKLPWRGAVAVSYQARMGKTVIFVSPLDVNTKM